MVVLPQGVGHGLGGRVPVTAFSKQVMKINSGAEDVS